MTCVMRKMATVDIEVDNLPIMVCQVRLLNEREFVALQSILANGYGTNRTELYILNKRTGRLITRKTIWKYDCILQANEKMRDYRRDSYTQESLWNEGQPWNPHQEWCLRKVAEFMATKSIYRNTESKKKRYKTERFVLRYPNYVELDQYLTANHKQFTHQQFLKERFNYVN